MTSPQRDGQGTEKDAPGRRTVDRKADPRDLLVHGVEDFIAQLDDETFADLVARTRDPEAGSDDELYRSIYSRR